MKVNLLEETKEAIEKARQCPENILFIGSPESGYECTWEEFLILANIEYENGYGNQEVATDLVIIFKNGDVMSRKEHDGKEWWDIPFNFVEQKRIEKKPIKKLVGTLWPDLEGLNK